MPNLDNIHAKFFPKAVTAQWGKKLLIFAWIIEITVAFVGFSIAILFFKSGGQSSLQIEDLASDLRIDSVIVGLAFFVVGVMELTKIPLATALYYAGKISWRIIFFVALFLVNFSTFETIIQGFELAYNQRSNLVLDERKKADAIKKEILNLEKKQDTSVIDLKISNLDNDLAKLRTERVVINKSKVDEIAQVRQQYTGDNQKISDLRDRVKGLDKEISGITLTLRELDSDLGKTKDGFFVKQSTKIKDRIKKYENQKENLVTQKNSLENQITALTSQASGTIDPLIKDIENKKNIELNDNQEQIDQINEDKYNLEEARGNVIQNQSNVEDKKRILSDELLEQDKKLIDVARESQIHRIAVKIKVASNWILGVESKNITFDESDLTQEDIDRAFWIWFGGLAFVISIIGTLVAFAGLHLQDERMHDIRNRPLMSNLGILIKRISNIFVILRKYIWAATKRLFKPKIVEKIIEVEKIVEKIIEKPVIEEKTVFQKVEVPKEVIRKEIVHHPLWTDDPDILKKEPFTAPKDKDKK